MFNLSLRITDFLTNCKNRRALNANMLKAYSTDLQQFSQHTNGLYEKESICDYLVFLHNNFKPKTVKRKIATLKAFTHYLLIEDIIETNPFDKIETTFREPIILPKTIPLNVIDNILKAAYSELEAATTNYKYKAILRDTTVLELLFCNRSTRFRNFPPDTIKYQSF